MTAQNSSAPKSNFSASFQTLQLDKIPKGGTEALLRSAANQLVGCGYFVFLDGILKGDLDTPYLQETRSQLGIDTGIDVGTLTVLVGAMRFGLRAAQLVLEKGTKVSGTDLHNMAVEHTVFSGMIAEQLGSTLERVVEHAHLYATVPEGMA